MIAGHAIPRLDAVTTGWVVLLCRGLGSAIIAALAAGITLPTAAFRASRLDAMNVPTKSAGPKSSAGQGERQLLRAVAIFQTALTLALARGNRAARSRTMVNLSKC